LTAIAYRDSREVARQTVRTPGIPVGLRLEVDQAGVLPAADGVDAVFVHAYIIDENGTTVTKASAPVTFTVDGNARILGGTPAAVDGGIASALLQAGLEPGVVTVTARSAELGEVSLMVTMEPQISANRGEIN
jgi:beta-galactosidase